MSRMPGYLPNLRAISRRDRPVLCSEATTPSTAVRSGRRKSQAPPDHVAPTDPPREPTIRPRGPIPENAPPRHPERGARFPCATALCVCFPARVAEAYLELLLSAHRIY